MQLFSPQFHWLGLTAKGKQAVGASIIGLFRRRCPADIHWAIMLNTFITRATPITSVIINTVKGVFSRRAWRDVRNKGFNCLPSLAHRNTSIPINQPVSVTGVLGTSSPDLLPSAISVVAGESVSGSSLTHLFLLQAPATTGSAAGKFAAADFFHRAAGTFAPPPRFPVGAPCKSKDGQAVEMTSLEVFEPVCWFRLKFNATLVVGHLANSFLVRNLARTSRQLISALKSVFILPHIYSMELNITNLRLFQESYA